MSGRVVRALVAAALGVLLLPSLAVGQEIDAPRIRAGALPEQLTIDGALDEDPWNAAESVDAFTQTEPSEGSSPSGRTVVRVLAGPKGLAIGIMCEDADPTGVVSFSVRRDAPLGSEDHVRVVLGLFLDGRSGYVFATNPSGARYDGLIQPGGESDDPDWDGIWEAARAWSSQDLVDKR